VESDNKKLGSNGGDASSSSISKKKSRMVEMNSALRSKVAHT
jgi:hypothetical protein